MKSIYSQPIFNSFLIIMEIQAPLWWRSKICVKINGMGFVNSSKARKKSRPVVQDKLIFLLGK